MRAGLTQKELSELTGRERSVIARWEQGVISPPIDKTADEELREALLATPSERVEWLVRDLGQDRARARR